MAGAIIIACAIGVLMLVLVGFVVVDNTLVSSNTIASAQKDMVRVRVMQMETQIDVVDADIQDDTTWHHNHTFFSVKNTGELTIRDLDKIGVVIIPSGTQAPTYYRKGDGFSSTWDLIDDHFHTNQEGYTNEVINFGQWDPGEYMYGFIEEIPYSYVPGEVHVFTANGITDYVVAS